MRKNPSSIIEKYRIKNIGNLKNIPASCFSGNKNHGVFEFKKPEGGKRLFVISSEYQQWEHVSVHVISKKEKIILPSWNDMCFLKDLFFDPDETVIQYHPKKTEYVNVHPGVLHLWKVKDFDFPLPPIFLV